MTTAPRPRQSNGKDQSRKHPSPTLPEPAGTGGGRSSGQAPVALKRPSSLHARKGGSRSLPLRTLQQVRTLQEVRTLQQVVGSFAACTSKPLAGQTAAVHKQATDRDTAAVHEQAAGRDTAPCTSKPQARTLRPCTSKPPPGHCAVHRQATTGTRRPCTSKPLIGTLRPCTREVSSSAQNAQDAISCERDALPPPLRKQGRVGEGCFRLRLPLALSVGAQPKSQGRALSASTCHALLVRNFSSTPSSESRSL